MDMIQSLTRPENTMLHKQVRPFLSFLKNSPGVVIFTVCDEHVVPINAESDEAGEHDAAQGGEAVPQLRPELTWRHLQENPTLRQACGSIRILIQIQIRFL
jgi:hypothetical protein